MELDEEQAMLRRQRRFLEEVERDIRRVNRDTIHAVLAPLGRQRFIDLARVVARRRVEYLRLAIELSECGDDAQEAGSVLVRMPTARRNYVEAREAFAALERAIERGYVDVE